MLCHSVKKVCACLHVCSLTKFDWSVHPQQHVVTLDVSMNDLVGVKKLQSLEDLDTVKEQQSITNSESNLNNKNWHLVS